MIPSKIAWIRVLAMAVFLSVSGTMYRLNGEESIDRALLTNGVSTLMGLHTRQSIANCTIETTNRDDLATCLTTAKQRSKAAFESCFKIRHKTEDVILLIYAFGRCLDDQLGRAAIP
jgi:hypothetical protein